VADSFPFTNRHRCSAPNAHSAPSFGAGTSIYLFAGSDSGGERAAAIYALIGTAKLNGMDAKAYFRAVLTRVADHRSVVSKRRRPGTPLSIPA
jgi:hypothetical protein